MRWVPAYKELCQILNFFLNANPKPGFSPQPGAPSSCLCLASKRRSDISKHRMSPKLNLGHLPVKGQGNLRSVVSVVYTFGEDRQH